MSERQEPYSTDKAMSTGDVTAIKSMIHSIETAYQNEALFFLAQEILKIGAVPTSSKGLAQAIYQASQRLKQDPNIIGLMRFHDRLIVGS